MLVERPVSFQDLFPYLLSKRSTHTRDFEAVRKPCVNKIFNGKGMYLRLVLQSAEWMRKNYTIIILLKCTSGLVVLIWGPRLPSIGSLNRLAGALAGASLYIYMIHWQVYPRLDQYSPVLAMVAALLAGIACAAATSYVRRSVRKGTLYNTKR